MILLQRFSNTLVDTDSSTEQRCLLLLTCDGTLRTLTGACVGLGALTVNRQAATVTQTLVAADFNLAANIGCNLAAKITFNPVS